MRLNVSPSTLATSVALHHTALCCIDKAKLLSTVLFTTLFFKILIGRMWRRKNRIVDASYCLSVMR